MPAETATARWLRRAAITSLVVLALAAAQAGLMVVALRDETDAPVPLRFPIIFVWHLASLLPWTLLAPTLLALAERFPPARPFRWVAVHLPAALVAAAALASAAVAANLWLRPFGRANGEQALLPALLTAFGATAPLYVVSYFAVLGGGQAVAFYRRFREREIRATQLESRLANARLEALRLQIQPHFLFNTLHTAAGLMRQGEATAAIETLSRLSELLRVTLDGEGRQLVPLAEELRVADLYLAIQQARFSDRLRVEREVDPAVLAVPVPSFVLQPLLENAVRHGIAARAGAGTVRLAAARAGDTLHLEVHDDGPGPAAAAAPAAGPPVAAVVAPLGEPADRRGVGLANVRSRLEHLYGGAAALDLLPRRDGVGTIARLTLPLRPSPAAAAVEGASEP